jgi:hypothetical protein
VPFAARLGRRHHRRRQKLGEGEGYPFVMCWGRRWGVLT